MFQEIEFAYCSQCPKITSYLITKAYGEEIANRLPYSPPTWYGPGASDALEKHLIEHHKWTKNMAAVAVGEMSLAEYDTFSE